MLDSSIDTTIARQVEHAVVRLESLSTLPSVATRLFSELLKPRFSTSALADIISADPALVCRLFSIMHREKVSFAEGNFSLRHGLDKLPADIVRDGLCVDVIYQSDIAPDKPRKQLTEHSLAVACCAESIAEIISPRIDSRIAYFAGLLHDIGKLAIDQVMPKSFSRILEEARSENAAISTIEQKHLGTDHTVLGKRLAEKWNLPGPITLAIWLHHSDTGVIAQSMPEARIAQVVQLADLLARQCGIGHSGSYDSPMTVDTVAQSLAVTSAQLEQVRGVLSEKVQRKTMLVGLDATETESATALCEVFHNAAVQLAGENAKLSIENRRLQAASSRLDFVTELLANMNSPARAIDVAESIAVRWQKFYQTGMVCLYFESPGSVNSLEAVLVENLAQVKTFVLEAPGNTAAIPKAIQNGFGILESAVSVDWLFEQLDVDFESTQVRIVPLLCGGRAIGAIVFELRYPGDMELFRENFESAACLSGTILAMACNAADQERFAEQFVRLVSGPREIQPQVKSDDSLGVLTEMAAGAAHELNNPLSVISGRAQLLGQTETEPQKKQILDQIDRNCKELTGIIDDLMSFADPPQPKPELTDIKQMLDEAVQLTSRKTNVPHINAQIEIGDELRNVFVDSAQIVSAIANIISNSLQSYKDELGPIRISVAADGPGQFVKIEVADLGCGMDEEIIVKAAQPFFSSLAAGRKRGMGLAHAKRIIELNKGSLDLTSQPGSGTTVTIRLPQTAGA